ncbi:hypothetical protein DM02DRAFT_222299 [Periconia macrospinosa]|uniref:Uncharacterized protein n=1 Tax=Periconia macrospinosa TaxID=97972 RepID=A0A2V1D608_9PLEO|nr:hypothetical protein DM02DRAFT_222299 [Periconia macrospinosa]
MPHSPSHAQRARQPHSHFGVRFSHDVHHPSLPAPNTMPGSIAHAAAQTASAGDSLSKDLYRFVRFPQGPTNNADVPDDVQSVARSLDSLARQLQPQNTTSVLSENAIQDANDLIARSGAVFTEVRQFIDNSRQRGRNGEANSPAVDESAWPMSEQSTELLRRRLGSLKDSLALILHILHFAHVQARGGVAERDQEEERNKVRDLHIRQQNSLEALKAIESKLSTTYSPDGDGFQASNIPSRIPTIDFIVNTQGPSRTPPSMRSTFRGVNPTATTADHFSEHSQASDSEDTVTDEDDADGEHGVERRLTADGVAHCAAHIQELLKGFTNLQRSSERKGRLCPRYRVQKLYKRFCRRFESSMEDRKPSAAAPAVPFPGFQPPPDSRNDLASHRPHLAAPDLRSNSVYSYESSSRNLAPIHELRRTQSVGTQSHYIDRLSTGITHNEPQPNGRDDRVIDPHLRAISERNPSISAIPMTHVQNEMMSRESSKEGSQSGADRDGESMSGRSAPVHYTKTGRISKAKKGLKVHACSECGKVKSLFCKIVCNVLT